jgi:hypothetical protein
MGIAWDPRWKLAPTPYQGLFNSEAEAQRRAEEARQPLKAAPTSRSLVAAQTRETSPSAAQNLTDHTPAEGPSILFEPVQHAALLPHWLENLPEKNTLVDRLFADIRKTFQDLKLASV